ncbi:hypothetical protein NLJ89_g6515 [Agrocybe chaxingu]|uniref:CST complex subunit STN1 n=1 Tax=Agrocybe chaxingu TaxID=84603 RepID=A0A9W8MWB8_9AGAR|nr:hypothetical protein NLJ89_g6515 [Agrocybe chaxingu]
MRENGLENYDFYWLGRRPCRTVKVLGMIVGIQVYEKRIIYSIDDGTSVIDCNHLHAAPKQSPPRGTASSRYKMSVKVEPPPTPKPIGRIGKFVRVVGRVRGLHDSRQIMVDDIELCSLNDELLHTRLVRHLHRTLYNQAEPFVIPPPPKTPNFSTPAKKKQPSTPLTMQSSPPSSVSSSPVKPEPDATHINPTSPPKFRHPSRLHTHDLTENTFRIYVKHYMDYAPPPQNHNDSGYDSDDGIGSSIAQIPSTPTKRPRSFESEETPRQPTSCATLDTTPKARMAPQSFGSRMLPTTQKKVTRFGFSLSYLRRVPELALLAYRVVEAVNRRRQREERRKLKEAGIISRTSRTAQKSKSSSTSSSVVPIPREKLPGKMKRLFHWAIIKLLEEGSIVLWDGPVRTSLASAGILNASRLWKSSNTSDLTLLGDSTLFSSSTTLSLLVDDEEDSGSISDPPPNEEAYVSLTGEYLADYVEGAIKVLVDHYAKLGKPYAGATKEGILSVLRKKDDQWRHLGEWTVEDALTVLSKEGRVWRLGNGRWDLTD